MSTSRALALCRLLTLLAFVRRGLRLLPLHVDRAVGGALFVHSPLRLVAAVVLLVLAHRVPPSWLRSPVCPGRCSVTLFMWSRSSTRGAARSRACACPSRTSATFAARTACPPKGSSGCRSARS